MKKRVLSLVLALTMIFSIASASFSSVLAEGLNVITLGDSVSTGFGLEGYTASPVPFAKDSYLNVIAEKTGAAVKNFAVDGLTSAKLLENLKAISADTKNEAFLAVSTANVINITIGGNDLLGALFLEVASALNMDTASATFATDVVKAISSAFASNDMETLLKINGAIAMLISKADTIAAAYTENLTQIVTAIKAVNPNAVVIIQTIANPYKGIAAVESSIKDGLIAFNNVIINGSAAGGYKVADVYKAFDESSDTLTNASNPATYLDVHPNKAGHAVIAETVIQAMMPKTEDKTSEEEQKEDVQAPKLFADVKETDWYYAAVTALTKAGVISLEDGEMFGAEKNVTKGECVELVTSALKAPVTVENLVELKLLPADFKAEDAIMRQELFSIIYGVINYLKMIPSDTASEKSLADFKDAQLIVEQAQKPVETLYKLGVINGNGNGMINPMQNVIKSELVQIIFNLLNIMK